MKRFFTLYKIEQKLFFRSPDVFVFNLCMPVVTLLLIGFIAGNKTATGSDITFIQSAFASLTAVGICCSAFMSIPIVMVDYRDKKILKHLYCSPASPASLLAAALCRTTKSLNVATFILYFPMLFFSGATIPYELFPKGLQRFADVMPLGIGIDLMKAASMGSDMSGIMMNIIILAAIAVICSIAAVRTFRWE